MLISAICTSACQNSGTCSAPDTCSCTSSWTDATCSTPICNIPCQNGGTCSAPDACSCVAGWGGSICITPDTPTLTHLRNLIAAVPAPVLYLPLSKQFGLNDASNNGHNGIYSSTKVAFVNGPTGSAETAIETGAQGDQQFVTVGNYEPLDFDKNTGTSWTITLFTFRI